MSGPGGAASWAVASTPAVPGAHDAGLVAVSCATSDNCMAVGSWSPTELPGGLSLGLAGQVGSTDRPLIEHFDGTRWSKMASASDTGALTAVSCASVTFCMAVGGTADGSSLTEVYDGKSWNIVPSPNLTSLSHDVNALSAVVCTSNDRCVAVGSDTDTATTHRAVTYQPLAILFSHGTWRPMAQTTEWRGRLRALSCGPDGCLALGSAYAPTRRAQVVLTFASSSWRDAPTPQATFSDVWCATISDCAAVGTLGTSPVIEHFDGRAWSVEPLRLATAEYAQAGLAGIDCAGSGSCVAVGDYQVVDANGAVVSGTTNGIRSLIMTRSGKTWVVMPNPLDDRKHDYLLRDVSCPAANHCVAVGMAGNTVNPRADPVRALTLIQR